MRTTAFALTAALFTAPAFAQVCVGGADALEDNDDCASAVALPGASTTGLTVEVGDKDFYSITVPDNSILQVDATHILADGDIDTYLWDPAVSCDTDVVGEGAAGGPLALGFSFLEPESFTYANTSGASQSLIIEVRLWAGDTSGSLCNDYTLDAVVTPITCPPADALEDNDDCASAVALPGGSATGLSVEDLDPDFYTVTVAAGDDLNVDATFINADGDLDVYIWDPAVACDSAIEGEGAASALAIGFSVDDNENVVYTNSSGASQNLIVEVRTFSTSLPPCNSYDLSIATVPSTSPCLMPDAFEDNDDCASAMAISDGTITGLNITDSDPDFYSFSVPDSGILDITVSFIDADGDLDTYLWDPAVSCDSAIVGQGTAGNPLANGFSTTDDEVISYTNVSGATQNLILEVSAFGAVACNTYDITISGTGGVAMIGTPFCSANVNSTGVPGEISATGSTAAADNNVTLSVANIPGFQFGIFVVSSTAGAMSPVNEGILCLSNDIGRYQQPGQIYQADANGDASFMIDLTAIPQPSSLEMTSPGDTWFFQAWHRDFVNGDPGQGNTSNFTNGVQIMFI